MRGSRTIVAAGGLLILALLLLPGRLAAEEGPPDAAGLARAALEASRAKLAAGDADAAFALALEALEYTSSDLELLDHASSCAEEAGQKDEALWLAQVAVVEGRAQGAKAAALRAREGRVGALDPLEAAARPRLDVYGKEVLELGRYCVKRKLYANAVDFLERCDGLPSQADAREALEKLYESKQAVQALLDSGLDVPVHDRRGRRALRMAAQDPKHAVWKKAWRLKGDNYTVVTNMSWEKGDAVLRAMEQMNRFYRRVFQHKVGGGNTARCTISLYRTFEEFSARENEDDPTTQGFFIPGENRVATYDPRGQGFQLLDLWETLFHECSHQFTDMISTGTIPDWLNEGTATYFEGSRLRASGRVECNLVHEGRLRSLKDVLGKGSPSLRQTVSWFSDTEGYGLDYYPVGWGLVYFLKNYEDPAHERVYEPYYEAFMAAYRSGGKHDPFERFVDHFVKKPRQDGVRTFEDFERRWRAWILELYDLQFGPPERADLLLARARGQVAAGKRDAAEESLRWALRKRPRDPAALLELARLHDDRKEKDAALACYRRLLALLARAGDAEAAVPGLEGLTAAAVTASCEERIRKLDARLLDALAEPSAALRERVAAAAAAAAEGGYPRHALFQLDGALRALGGDDALAAQRDAIVAAAGVEVWRPRRVLVPADLAPFETTPEWSARQGALHAVAVDPATVMLRELPPRQYRFEITFRATNEQDGALVGLLFGVDESGDWDVLVQSADGTREVNRVLEEWKTTGVLKGGPAARGEPVTLAVEVDGGHVAFFADGEKVGTLDYPPSELLGEVGIVAQGCEVVCSDLKLAIR
jgi:hypothetical protein